MNPTVAEWNGENRMPSWIERVFVDDAGNERTQVREKGVLRRAKTDVDNHGGLSALKAEVVRRGFSLFENNNEYIVVCDTISPVP
jgi:hypothetical protein